MTAVPFAVAAVQAVQHLADEVEFLQEDNDHLKEENRSLKKDIASLKEEIVSLKSKKQTPISPPNTRSTPGSGTSTTAPKITGTQASRPINDAYSIFSDVFAKVKTDDGWVQDTMFVNALNKLYPDFRSSSYWKGKLHRTVDAYSDVIEKKGDEKNPKKFYFRLKRRESGSTALSSQPTLKTKAVQTLSPQTGYEPRYGYGHGEVMRGDERTDARAEMDTRQGIYDPIYGDRYLGTEVRDHGQFGTLPLSDDYGEESNP